MTPWMQLIFHMDCPLEGQVNGFPSLSHIVFWDKRVYSQKHHYGTTFSIWAIIHQKKKIYNRTPVSLSVSGSLNVATCFTFIICFPLNFISNIYNQYIYSLCIWALLFNWFNVSNIAVNPFNSRSMFRCRSNICLSNKNTYPSLLTDESKSCWMVGFPLPFLMSTTIITSLYINQVNIF